MSLKSESHYKGINLETGKDSEDTYCFVLSSCWVITLFNCFCCC